MASKMNEYYQITWLASGLTTPLLTKRQLLVEIETNLINLSEDTMLNMSINQIVMSEKEFKNRPNELRTYGYSGIVN